MEIESSRALTPTEKKLLHALVDRSPDLQWFKISIDRLKVIPLNDEGMGSLRLLSSGSRKMGSRASEITFLDEDGVDVIASLNLDEKGVPFEIDIWKTNFAPLIRIPDNIDIPD